MKTPMIGMCAKFARMAAPFAAMLLLVAVSTPAHAAKPHAKPHATPHHAAQSHPHDQSRVIMISAANPGPQHLVLPLDKAAVVELDTNASDVLVSNPQIVDAVVRSPRRVFMLAQKVGQTNAFFFDSGGHQIASLDIRVERDTADLGQAIAQHMPDSQVKVDALNDNIVLDGSVKSAKDASAAQDLATRFAGSPDKVVNMLKVEGRQQVMIQVRVSEMNRNIAKQFGVNLSSAVIAGGVPIIAATSNPYGLLGRALADASGAQIGSVCPQAFMPNKTGTSTTTTTDGVASTVSALTSAIPCKSPNNLQGVLKALEQVGLVRTLAEPNLTAVSGESAKFLAGGEFPVPASRDQLGNVVVTFKQFGVGLAFTPVVLSAGRISLQVSTEVSELTTEGAFIQNGSTVVDANGNTVTTPGLTVPALSVRRAETTVELPSGGSLVIGGLLQRQTKQTLDAYPGLKDLPVLGALFRSRDFSNNETELVVMVTAYLVGPTSQDKIAMPDDGYAEPADVETILFGRLNAVYGKGSAQAQTAGRGAVGYIIQ
jgi:pilus assembly protein CpaC